MSSIGFNRRQALRSAKAFALILSLAGCSGPATSDATSRERDPESAQRTLLSSAVAPLGGNRSNHTNFNPAADGFQFINSFQNVFGPVETGGLCGGMSYSALDYFYANMTIPQQNYRPEENTPLQSYVYGRQETSIQNNASQWASWAVNPGGINNGAIQGDSLSREVGLVVASIDQGHPIPLGLDGASFGKSHQVLAVGYSIDSNPNDVQIYLYNPNYPGRQVTLVFDVSAQVFTMAEYPLADQYIGFFADTSYSAETPPTVPEPIYANDGLVHELFITVATGPNALQNGANAALEIGLTNGPSQTLPNLNLGEKWVPNYTETVRYVLPTPIDPTTIASLTLSQTDSCGLWDVMSAVVQAVGSSTWVIATAGPHMVEFACGEAPNWPLSIVQRPPTVTSVTPKGAAAGATVAISGTGFSTDGSTYVTFGSAPAITSCASTTACTAIVPAGSGSVALTLSKNVIDSSQAVAHPPASLNTFSTGAGQFYYPPGCTYPAQSSCDTEYVPPGYGTQVGDETVETIHVTCPASSYPLDVLNGSGTSLAHFTPNASYTAWTPGEFVLGVESQGTTTSGAPIGSTQTLQTCTVIPTGGEACDAPMPVTITNCCQPATCGGGGFCGEMSDGCGGQIICGGCPSGAVCVGGLCQDTGAKGECEAEGGTWANGKCIRIPPPKCGDLPC
jgi:hypothetical protein